MTRNLLSLTPTPKGILQINERSPVHLHPLFSLVIPTYNERQTIEPLIGKLSHLLDSSIPDDYELIVVDDNSPDETWDVALQLTAVYPHLKVMRRDGENGLSSAVVRGWQVAQGQILGVIDADLQHPPTVLLELLQAALHGADLAVASRHVEGGGVSEWSIARRSLSRGAQVLGLIVLPDVVGRVSDPMSGYFVVQRAAIANQSLNPKGYKILLEVLGRGSIQQIAEVGYVFQERTEGESKVTWRHYLDYVQHLIRLRWHRRFPQTLFKFPIGRFVRFAVVGFSGVFVDYAVFYLLFNQAGFSLNVSNVLSAETAIFNNFLWNDAWTFSDLAQRQLGWQARGKRFLKFNLICLAGLLLNTAMVNVLVRVFGVNVYLAKFVAIALVTIWNFGVNLKLSWRVTDVQR
ncbi:glycosyltransferase family 2 protein [Oscillatoria sp. CS-180]|uniref:glycosyltransferase n=1 Tax=Oscillatoria sp. CS-180 TaxID=3021720 RepID=UPI00232ADC84|nr:glycosyltransferase family 2 protein [Oscillatoria sp. CS-180]MDB9528797.1 glycosyltransferase family 2 protein [Oscillatoria sp. CS-180]